MEQRIFYKGKKWAATAGEGGTANSYWCNLRFCRFSTPSKILLVFCCISVNRFIKL